MRLSFLLVVVLVVLAANFYGPSAKKIIDNNHVRGHSIHRSTRVNIGESKFRAEGEEGGEAQHAELSTLRSRNLQTADTTNVAKPMDDQSEERGAPITSALKTFSQKDKNDVFSRFKGLLGRNPSKLTQKNVEDIKKNSKLKGLLSKNPSTLNEKSAGILRTYLAKNGWTQIYGDAVVAIFGASALVGWIYLLHLSHNNFAANQPT